MPFPHLHNVLRCPDCSFVDVVRHNSVVAVVLEPFLHASVVGL